MTAPGMAARDRSGRLISHLAAINTIHDNFWCSSLPVQFAAVPHFSDIWRRPTQATQPEMCRFDKVGALGQGTIRGTIHLLLTSNMHTYTYPLTATKKLHNYV